MATVVRADFYAHLAASAPAVLRVERACDLDDAAERLDPLDLIVVPASAFTSQDEDEVAGVLRAAGRLLGDAGRLALDYPNPRHGDSALPTAERLDHLLAAAGLVVHERYGDFARAPFAASSPEIITVAGRR